MSCRTKIRRSCESLHGKRVNVEASMEGTTHDVKVYLQETCIATEGSNNTQKLKGRDQLLLRYDGLGVI